MAAKESVGALPAPFECVPPHLGDFGAVRGNGGVSQPSSFLSFPSWGGAQFVLKKPGKFKLRHYPEPVPLDSFPQRSRSNELWNKT
jgi:hypothetical protein